MRSTKCRRRNFTTRRKVRAQAKSALLSAAYIAAAVAIIVCAWSVGAAIVGSEFVLPSIPRTFAAFGEVFNNLRFYSAVCGTLLRCVIGFIISLALFFVTLYFSTAFNGFKRVIEPIISALRSLPAVAVTLVLAITVGGYGAPIVLGVLVIYPIMYSAAKARLAAVPRELEEVCAICGAGRWGTFTNLYLPFLAGGMPEITASAFSYNIKTVIGAEILAQTAASLGMMMRLAQSYLQTAMLIAFVLIAVTLSVLIEAALRVTLRCALAKFCD